MKSYLSRRALSHEKLRDQLIESKFNLPRTNAACIRSKVGMSMLSVIWFAASLILARPQAARSSSSGSLDEGDIIPRSKTRPDKVDTSFRQFQIVFIYSPESCEIACLPIAAILCMTAKANNFVSPWLCQFWFLLASNICLALLVLMCDCFTGTFCGRQPLNVTSSNRKAQTPSTGATDTKHWLMI